MTVPELNDLEEARIMLSERVVDWTQQWKQEGEAALLRRQLARRFGTLPAWADEHLARASIEELETWGDRVLDAATLIEVLGHPGH
ncbi:MAG: DUF4351 domain-containing protein [Candidatus Competibacteraceae bacterium]